MHYRIPCNAYPWRPCPTLQMQHSLGLPWTLHSLSRGAGGGGAEVEVAAESFGRFWDVVAIPTSSPSWSSSSTSSYQSVP